MAIHFLPVAHEIRENALLAEEFDRFQSFTIAAVRLLKDGMISDWADFLEKLIPNLTGGEVLQRPGTLLESTLVKYEPCNSVSVYRYRDGLMQLVEYSGRITPPEFYPMEEESSFVVTAYKNDVQDVRYNEDKQTLYYTLRSGEYAVCFHFRLQEKWTQANVASFKNEFYHAIITSNASLYFDFVAELLGGLKNESKSNIQQ
ncbi:hypothetical protein AM501_02745 [Aneurinibacillus migulanus]|uniref:hypothetical protein n=1 Tax=Aneurinibacillus migulanus TaxID=47500 RepID=UPI0005BD9CF4|nr:hypothetical protein [Aneurinibacillus migulanus]KIV56890.1 hypothetical protein TS64_09030 [Aneurinibacillus migulanus]KPD09711.1 hypothetical protein AM501_02745 [Aneurinibacillus migulanus]